MTGPPDPYIPFNRPFATGTEGAYIQAAIDGGHLSGGGPFARRCEEWLEHRTGCARAFLTHSCTGALEIAVHLCGIAPGDEVIMPSYTFVSAANAVALRGGVPVFVDVRPDTLNLDEERVEAAITPRTRAIVAAHYGGVACELDRLVGIARAHDLVVIEDAAHSLAATYRDRPLGGIGDLGAISFHETKNVSSGEGGALLLRDSRWVERAEVLHEKGTDRSRFFRGEVDHYTWQELGSSFAPSEVTAAFLWSQLEVADRITSRRMRLWRRYHAGFAELEREGRARRPVVRSDGSHSAHLYYLLVADRGERNRLIDRLERRGINAVFHYVPLHSSPAGRRYGRAVGDLPVTDEVSGRVVRLPLWVGMTGEAATRVVTAVYEELGSSPPGPAGSLAARTAQTSA